MHLLNPVYAMLELERFWHRIWIRYSRPSSSTSQLLLGDPDADTQVLISTIDYNEYVGRIGVGKVENGSITC